MKEELVDVEEIWIPTTKDDNAAAITRDGKYYKCAAYIVNGVPVVLQEGFILERRKITKTEGDHIILSHSH